MSFGCEEGGAGSAVSLREVCDMMVVKDREKG
jgi:hypothetical protein